MNDMEDSESGSMAAPEGKFKVTARRWWIATFRVLNRVTDIVEADWAIIKREGDLFGGAFIFLLGLLNMQSGKYCDGNAADYLACTRPTTYYYYNGFEIFLIIVGIFLILLWFQKRRS